MGCDGVVCIHMAQNSVQWRVLVNMILSLQVSENPGEFLYLVSDF
jgi:hypothetical protein